VGSWLWALSTIIINPTITKKVSAITLLILAIMFTPSDSHAERKDFLNKSNKAEDQLFDYKYGWELCQRGWDEIVKLNDEVDSIRKKYRVADYLRNPSEKVYQILDANRVEVEKMFDVVAIHNVLWSNFTCEELKQEGFFGKP
jgi:hypothetical protein